RFRDGRFVTDGGLPVITNTRLDGRAVLAVRPERIALSHEPIPGAANCLQGEVEFVSYLGSAIDVHVRLNEHDSVIAQIVNGGGVPTPALQDRVYVSLPANISVFAAESGLRAGDG